MSNNPSFNLKHPTSQSEWDIYHYIRKVNLFNSAGILYDPNHPSLVSSSNYHYIFTMDEEIIGTAQIELLDDIACALRTIAIADPHKNKGYGSILLKNVEQLVKNFGRSIIHLHANHRAINFYQRNAYIKMIFPNDIPLHEGTIDMGKVLINIDR